MIFRRVRMSRREFRGGILAVARSVVVFVAAVVAAGMLDAGTLRAEGASYRIDGVSVEGNRHIDPAAITVQLKGTSGVVTRDQISEDIKALYRTGFFDQVSASVVHEGARTVVKYSVVEKPLVRKVFIKGNKEVKE